MIGSSHKARTPAVETTATSINLPVGGDENYLFPDVLTDFDYKTLQTENHEFHEQHQSAIN